MVTRGHWGHVELQFWANVLYAEHGECLSFNRYLLNTNSEPDPGDISVNEASRLLELFGIWSLATSPWSLFLSSLAHYASVTLAFLSVLETIKIIALLEISHSFFPLISTWPA